MIRLAIISKCIGDRNLAVDPEKSEIYVDLVGKESKNYSPHGKILD